MRIVFLGASQFGLRCLGALAGLPGISLAGVVTAPRTFAISYRPQGVTNVLHADVAGWCEARGLPIATLGPQGMRTPGLWDAVQQWEPDAFVVAGWYHMVPKAWRELAPAYGLHASLLPAYRGGAPLVWAMIHGERQTGITLFEFDDGVDTGPIVAQASTPIAEDDTIGTVYARIEALGERLLVESLPGLAAGTLRPRPQPEGAGQVFAQRGPEDGRIDWHWPARRIHDFVRAQTRPYPGAFFLDGARRVTVWAARVAAPAGLPPGDVAMGDDNGVRVGAGEGTALELLELQIDGHDMPPTAWVRSRHA
ncbi:methionyl-tRNA formyltransferase [Ramlibacter rhizophilus]|uniref:methionyl-tRNA formyltransferase n=1 Tax=Ramlibacter rhizophilus TaxID=1781167 RepID=A0A4Z0BMM6_9BURK|nr:methionyl-tRNA formyltransferase [Ramlibacter rhizophilus]TFY99669.1 methionyl-tRNA formyltransferase [Ramlibacter rhizophilus]